MTLKLLILFLIFLSTAYSKSSKNYLMESCCFCIADSDPQSHRRCSSYLAENKKKCRYRHKLDLKLFHGKRSLLKKQPVQCKSVKVWGAYHGLNDKKMTNLPFNISKGIAIAFSSKSVCYDGDSCLVFDNINEVKKCGISLGKAVPNCKFSISSNQNNGVLQDDKKGFFRPKMCTFEPTSTTSKLTLEIDKVITRMVYDKCSKADTFCAFDTGKESRKLSKNGSSTKLCMSKNTLTSQTCCQFRKDLWQGYWGHPGKKCHAPNKKAQRNVFK